MRVPGTSRFERARYVGPSDVVPHSTFFCRCAALCARVRTAEVAHNEHPYLNRARRHRADDGLSGCDAALSGEVLK